MTAPASQSCGRLLGLAFSVSGVAHLLCPRAFEPVNRLAFDDNVRRHVIVNGTIETALGLAILNPRIRRAAYAATAVYGSYFIANVLRQRREKSPPTRRWRYAGSRMGGGGPSIPTGPRLAVGSPKR